MVEREEIQEIKSFFAKGREGGIGEGGVRGGIEVEKGRQEGRHA